MEKTIENLYIYFRLLIKTNVSILKVINLDIHNEKYKIEDLFKNAINNIFVLLPCKVNKELQVILYKSNLEGLLCFQNDFKYIEIELESIINEYNEILYNLKLARNKLEHCPQSLEPAGRGSCLGAIGIEFCYKSKRITINSSDIIKILVKLNNLFNRITKETNKFKTAKNNLHEIKCYDEMTDFNYEVLNNMLNSIDGDMYTYSYILNQE